MHGVYVPKAGTTDPRSGHHGIAWAARADRRYRTELGDLGDLCRELSAASEPVAVISSEALGYLVEQGDSLRHMESALRQTGWEPHYLVYLRRQGNYAASLWKELAKHGLSVGYARFVLEILLRGRVVTRDGWVFHFDYARFLDRWRAVTTGAIQARAYEPGRPAAHLIRDFLVLLGVAAPAAATIAEQTPALNVGDRGRPGLIVDAADALLTARFARANARLRRSWHVDLMRT
ncbi:MAG: hypothetical protein AB7I59_05840 [Geminicoccaceae bacterium]